MADWLDVVFEKSANYLNKINEINAANVKVNYNVEYELVWGGEGNVMGWAPNFELKIDKDGFIYINDNRYNAFDYLKPVESRGLYDLCIDNHIDIPDSIPKDSPCYKQFMKEKENV